jgi:hypothetical protein
LLALAMRMPALPHEVLLHSGETPAVFPEALRRISAQTLDVPRVRLPVANEPG